MTSKPNTAAPRPPPPLQANREQTTHNPHNNPQEKPQFLSKLEKTIYQTADNRIWAEKIDKIAGFDKEGVNSWINMRSSIPNLISAALNGEGKQEIFFVFDENGDPAKDLGFNFKTIDKMIAGYENEFRVGLIARRVHFMWEKLDELKRALAQEKDPVQQAKLKIEIREIATVLRRNKISRLLADYAYNDALQIPKAV